MKAVSPDFLRLKVTVQTARHKAAKAKDSIELARHANDRWERDTAKLRKDAVPDHRILTVQQAVARGEASGYKVLHSARHADDPLRVPYSDEDMARMETRAEAAATELADLEARFRALAADPDRCHFDPFGEGNHRYIHWPLQKYVDPDRYAYRGKPVTQEEVDRIGVHELRRQLRLGRIIERVPAATL